MAKDLDKLAKEIHKLSDVEKLRLVDNILTDLDRPDPEIGQVWAEEARKRWTAYKSGKIPTVSYDFVMAKHRRSRRYAFWPPRSGNLTMLSHGTTNKRRDWA